MTHAEIAQRYRDSDVEQLLATEAESSCWHYSAILRRAANFAADAGEVETGEILALLSVVVGATIRQTAPDFPFEPLFFPPDRRIDPVELGDEEVHILDVVSGITLDPLVKARVLDVLWFARRQFHHCNAAVQAYFQAAETGRGSFTYKIHSYRRGTGLARSLGARHQVFRDARNLLVTRTRDIAQNDRQSFYACQMFAIIEEFAAAEQSREFVTTAHNFAAERLGRQDFYGAEHYLQSAASLERKVGDEANASNTDRLLGECYVERGEHQATQNPPDFMGAVHWISRGVEQLQRSTTNPQRLTQLRIRLQELQRRNLGELRPLMLPADLQTALVAEQEHNRRAISTAVAGLTLQQALIRLAMAIPLASFPAIQQQIVAGAQAAPFQAMIDRDNLDARGRVRAVANGMFGDAAEAEEAIRQRAYEHLSRVVGRPRADLIATACDVISSEHIPFVHDLGFLVRHSPWVVQGHEEIILRGLHAGLYGDWLISGHLLFAQFEASLRSVMERLGVAFAVLERGVEEDRTLGALLKHERCADIIGADLQFELQGLLIEKNGANFRNDVAHGLVPDAGFYSSHSVTCWWLMLRLCCVPVPGLVTVKAEEH